MTESQPDSLKGSQNFCDGIDAGQNSETILKTLQKIASNEDVTSVAIRCLELLRHDDEEIRSWAIECLTSSIRPSKEEESSLLDALESKLNSKSVGSSANDELYWLVTLIGRVPLDDTPSQDRAKTLLTKVASLEQSPAAERAQRISQRIG